MLKKLFQLLDRFDRAQGGEIVDLYRIRLVEDGRWGEKAKKPGADAPSASAASRRQDP